MRRYGLSIVCLILFIGFAGPTLGMGRPPSEAVKNQLEEYRKVLLAYFRSFDLLPIILPSDQRPGDVFDLRQYGILRAKAAECFPSLKQPEPVPSALAFTFQLDTQKAGLALGLDKIASLGLDSAFEQILSVNYTDVKVRMVSQEALRQAVSDKCPDVKQIVHQLQTTGTKAPLLAIIGSLVTAKRQIFIGARDNVDVRASADKLGMLLASIGAGGTLKAIGLDPSMSATLGFGSKQGLLVQSNQELPIAFLPAFLPELIFPGVHTSAGVPSIAFRWKDVTAGSPESSRKLNTLVDVALHDTLMNAIAAEQPFQAQ